MPLPLLSFLLLFLIGSSFVDNCASSFLVSSKQSPHRSSLALLSSARDIFVVSFDGVVAQTAAWRIQLGIQAAVRTWPHLGNCLAGQWLSNKMLALSHIVEERPGTSLTCDYAVLARMLLEEQELDQGQSVGLNGNYASKFHPSSSSSLSEYQQGAKERMIGSRPLTVGEISANWSNGADLRETLLVKYNIDGNNPLPILQATIEELEDDTLLVVNNVICEALSQSMGHVIVIVGHESEVRILQRSLKDTPLGSYYSMSCAETNVKSQFSLLPNSDIWTIRQLLMEAPQDSTVHVVHSCWKTLQKAKSLFGDNIPRVGRFANAAVGNCVKLSLNLPDWAENTHMCQHNDAIMDPWTSLMTEDEFAELVSARIVKDSHR